MNGLRPYVKAEEETIEAFSMLKTCGNMIISVIFDTVGYVWESGGKWFEEEGRIVIQNHPINHFFEKRTKTSTLGN